MRLNPEPIIVAQGEDGIYHFATTSRPLRIVIDVYDISVDSNWLSIDNVKKIITISLDGEVLVYRRIGKDPHGWWVCDRVQHGDQLHEGDRA